MEKNNIISNIIKKIYMKTKSKKIREEAEELHRKSIEEKERVEKELKDAQEKLEEYKRLIEEAEAEEKKQQEDTLAELNNIAESRGYFLGIVLTKDDIFAILNMYIEKQENIIIPARLYLNENTDKND
jgi:uncharacterized protein YlxW (UPF0749 family)